MKTYDLGLALYFIRMLNGKTQKELAAEVGVRQDYISHLEAGDTKPTLSTLEKLIKALGVNFSNFFLLSEKIPELGNADKKMIKTIFRNKEKQDDLIKEMIAELYNYN